jgi:hypothetical protein
MPNYKAFVKDSRLNLFGYLYRDEDGERAQGSPDSDEALAEA